MHPILFHLPLPGFLASLLRVSGSVPITSYGIMLGISLILGWFLTLGLATRDGLPREAMANCYVDAAILALLGSRLLFIATNPSDAGSGTSFFQFRSGGLVAYGGFVGAFLGSYLSLRFGIGVTGLFRVLADLVSRKKAGRWRPLPLMPWADATAPSAALALFVTRIGCYLNGCDFGRPLPASAPAWLQRVGTFPRWPDAATAEQGVGSPAWKQHVDGHLISSMADASLPVHPTELYESLVGLVLFFAAFAFRKRQKFRGEVFLWFVILYGAARFLMELVRDNLQRGNIPPVAPPHVLYPLCLMGFGLAFAAGVAPRIESVLVRRVAQIVSFAPALATYLAYRPRTFEVVSPVELSTSQVVALLSGIAACGAFAVLHRGAVQHPEAAMALPDFSEWNHDDEDDDENEPADAEEKPAPEETRKNRKVRRSPARPKSVRTSKSEADDDEKRENENENEKNKHEETEVEKTEAEKTEADADADETDADKSDADKTEADKTEADKTEADEAQAEKSEPDAGEVKEAPSPKAAAKPSQPKRKGKKKKRARS